MSTTASLLARLAAGDIKDLSFYFPTPPFSGAQRVQVHSALKLVAAQPLLPPPLPMPVAVLVPVVEPRHVVGDDQNKAHDVETIPEQSPLSPLVNFSTSNSLTLREGNPAVSDAQEHTDLPVDSHQKSMLMVMSSSPSPAVNTSVASLHSEIQVHNQVCRRCQFRQFNASFSSIVCTTHRTSISRMPLSLLHSLQSGTLIAPIMWRYIPVFCVSYPSTWFFVEIFILTRTSDYRGQHG